MNNIVALSLNLPAKSLLRLCPQRNSLTTHFWTCLLRKCQHGGRGTEDLLRKHGDSATKEGEGMTNPTKRNNQSMRMSDFIKQSQRQTLKTPAKRVRPHQTCTQATAAMPMLGPYRLLLLLLMKTRPHVPLKRRLICALLLAEDHKSTYGIAELLSSTKVSLSETLWP